MDDIGSASAQNLLAPIGFLELELTDRCQLTCGLCCTESGPAKSHGTMSTTDWEKVIDSAPAVGVRKIQLIGGEPTLHPDFTHLLGRVLDNGLEVEVFSNLYNIPGRLWRVFERPRVSLATSYYSDIAAEHDEVTNRRGSHFRTRASIVEALRRGIPIRAGIIQVTEHQRVEQARAELETLGVRRVRVDRMRAVGRAAATRPPSTKELCGRCGDGRASISANGEVRMCLLARFLPSAGNVRSTSLADIFAGGTWQRLVALVPRRRGTMGCNPDSDGNDCSPAETIPPARRLGANDPAPATHLAADPREETHSDHALATLR